MGAALRLPRGRGAAAARRRGGRRDARAAVAGEGQPADPRRRAERAHEPDRAARVRARGRRQGQARLPRPAVQHAAGVRALRRRARALRLADDDARPAAPDPDAALARRLGLGALRRLGAGVPQGDVGRGLRARELRRDGGLAEATVKGKPCSDWLLARLPPGVCASHTRSVAKCSESPRAWRRRVVESRQRPTRPLGLGSLYSAGLPTKSDVRDRDSDREGGAPAERSMLGRNRKRLSRMARRRSDSFPTGWRRPTAREAVCDRKGRACAEQLVARW